MPRYIDAEKLKLDYAWFGNSSSEQYRHMKATFDRYVDGQPTADVVEVVRCEKCIHHINAPQTMYVWCECVDGLLPKDWFCADGEKLGSHQEKQTRLIEALKDKTAEEQYDFIRWLMHDYGMRFTDTRMAVIEWLREERNG